MLDLDEMLTLDEARTYLARRGVNVELVTLRVWINRGHLDVADRDRAGRPRVTVLALARAEHKTRAHARRTITPVAA